MVRRAGWEEICRRSRWEVVDGGLRVGHNESERLTEPTPSIPSSASPSSALPSIANHVGQRRGRKVCLRNLVNPKR